MPARRKASQSRHAAPWSKADLKTLKQHAGRKSSNELAALLQRTARAVLRKAEKLGVSLSTVRGWTPSEVQTLRRHAGKLPTAQLARRLNRTHKAVQQKATKLGLPLQRSG